MKIVVFEGTDGSGKSTCIQMAKDFLESQEKKVLVIKSPAILKTSLHPDEFFLVDDHTKFFLYLAQLQSIDQYLWDLRKKGEYDFILLDRFFDSTFVYSKLLKIKASKRKIFSQILHKYYYSSTFPNLIIYCTAQLGIILSRLQLRGEKHRVYDLKFAAKIFLERSEVKDSTQRELLLVSPNKGITKKDLFKKLKRIFMEEK